MKTTIVGIQIIKNIVNSVENAFVLNENTAVAIYKGKNAIKLPIPK